jgi:hypothetical protein
LQLVTVEDLLIGSYVDVRPPFTDGLAAENRTQPGAILIFIEGDA